MRYSFRLLILPPVSGITVKKIIITDTFKMKVKYVDASMTEVIEIDGSHLIPNLISIMNHPFIQYFGTNIRGDGSLRLSLSINVGVSASGDVLDPTLPHYLYLAGGETETDEAVTQFLRVPVETVELFKGRVQPRITIIAHRLAQGLPHTLPHLVEKSTSICNDVGASEVVKRFDHAANSLKLFIGYIQRKMNRLTAHDATVMQEIETLVDELEAVAPTRQEGMIKLFTRQNFEAWKTAHEGYQVHAGMTEDGMPGRLVYDIAEQHAWDPNDHPGSNFGDFNTTAATRDFHKLSADYYSSAIHSEHDELVRTRELVLEEYIPPERNAFLSDLLMRATYGNLAPSHLSVPTEFSHDVLDYRVTLDNITVGVAEDMVITATAQHPNAVVVGAGRVGDLHTIVDGENIFPIVVMSEDGSATRTYRIILIRS